MNDVHRGGALIRWWAMLAIGAAAALLIAWLVRVSGVPVAAVLSIAVGVAALGWLIVLVAAMEPVLRRPAGAGRRGAGSAG